MSESKHQRGRSKRGTENPEPPGSESNEATAGKLQRLNYYQMRDLGDQISGFGDRLDSIEEAIRGKRGDESTAEVVAPKAFKTSEERATWETTRRRAGSMHVRAVAATGLLGTQQEETQALLERRQGFHEAVQETVVEIAAHLTKHELLKRSLAPRDWTKWVTKIAPWVVAGIVAVVAIEGIFQPQNFQLVVNGLGDPRNLAIVSLLIVAGLGIWGYSVWQNRRRAKAGPF